MDYPTNLPVDAASVNISDGEFSPLYDIVWSIKYELIDWQSSDEYGICFFLQDSNVPLEGGGRGIDLGYSGTQADYPGYFYARGMSGAAIGVGIDTTGFFAAETTWPDGVVRTGIADSELIQNSITVRGSQTDNYNYLDTHIPITAFDMLSDGVKTLRARLGNYGRTFYLDYRDPGDTDYVNILTKDVDLSISPGDRLTPGVSFVKPVGSSLKPTFNIKVDTFHIEGKDSDPDISIEYPEPLEPLECTAPYSGNTIVDAPAGDIVTSDIPTLVMCQPPNPGDILISKTVTSTGPYEIGETIDYKIVVTSAGDYAFQGVTLTDTIPPSRRLNTVDSYGLFAGNKVLSPGQSVEVTYSYVVDINDGFSVDNTAKVTTGIGIQGESSITVQTVAAKDLTVSKEIVSTGPYEIGQNINYKVVVGNPNTVPITNIQLTDTLQPNISVTSDTSGLIVGGATINSGLSAEVLYTYNITNTNTINNIACVDSIIGTSCSESIATTVVQPQRLLMSKVVTSSGPYTDGSTISYSINVTNPNFAPQSDVFLTDTQSSEITNIVDSSGLFTGTTIPGNTTVTATYDYVIANNNGADIVNTARVIWPGDAIEASTTVVTKQKVCIYLSFCDESSSSSSSTHASNFEDFRINNPVSPFWIMQENDHSRSSLKIPSNFESDPDAEVYSIKKSTTQDWFNDLGLDKYGPGSEVYFGVDVSGSFSRSILGGTHGTNWSNFQSAVTTAFGTTVNDLGNLAGENWISLFKDEECSIDITIP